MGMLREWECFMGTLRPEVVGGARKLAVGSIRNVNILLICLSVYFKTWYIWAQTTYPAGQDSTRGHRKIIKDNNHQRHCLFTPLSSRRQGQCRGIKAGTESLKTASISRSSDCKIAIISTLEAAAYIHRLEITAHFNKCNTSQFNNVYIFCIVYTVFYSTVS
jgi:hypothetical protein